jgi:pyruvate,orthophosphate dikinase
VWLGCEELEFNLAKLEARARGKIIREGDFISVDGGTGEIFLGNIATVFPDPKDLRELMLLLEWADDVRTLEVWANADTPLDATKAREYGAQGIGLCRTEHMFFAAERLPHIQKLLTVAPAASRLRLEMQRLESELDLTPAIEKQKVTEALFRAREALAVSPQVKAFHESLEKLEEFQTKDFYEIFKIMEGLPVVIRLLDAPLHEFLPHFDQLNADVAVLQEQRTKDKERLLREKEQVLQLVETLREVNPMMGHRGCRVGLTMPEIYEMQVRAIVTAANQLLVEGYQIHPEVMLPVVSHVNEVVRLRRQLDSVAAETTARLKSKVTYEFGTMIEVPRAALTAGRIAQEVEFFSFGSNDLTQMTYAFSRDDAEAKFLRDYLIEGILPENPFESLDIEGVGQLMRIASQEGRATNPDLKIGICGEHGGDPKSIAFCYSLGLNYVSASPYRVPVARLAAAQSTLGHLKAG